MSETTLYARSQSNSDACRLCSLNLCQSLNSSPYLLVKPNPVPVVDRDPGDVFVAGDGEE